MSRAEKTNGFGLQSESPTAVMEGPLPSAFLLFGFLLRRQFMLLSSARMTIR